MLFFNPKPETQNPRSDDKDLGCCRPLQFTIVEFEYVVVFCLMMVRSSVHVGEGKLAYVLSGARCVRRECVWGEREYVGS